MLLCPAAGGRADEIVFKKEFGGGKVKCEIYKEEDDYIHYIDIKRKMACGCSKEIVEKIVREKKDLIDVEEFFLKKAKEAKDEKARQKAAKIAAELRKKREAEEKEAGKEKKVGKLRMRPASTVKILPSKDTGSNELLVDPFPEEDQAPAKGKEKGSGDAKTPKPKKHVR
jgi:hypothetical protein